MPAALPAIPVQPECRLRRGLLRQRLSAAGNCLILLRYNIDRPVGCQWFRCSCRAWSRSSRARYRPLPNSKSAAGSNLRSRNLKNDATEMSSLLLQSPLLRRIAPYTLGGYARFRTIVESDGALPAKVKALYVAVAA